jgi:hypothetical protein
MNYNIRFSSPKARLTARRLRGMVPHLPVRPSAMYKEAFLPRRFSNSFLNPFCPLHSPARPRSASGLGELYLHLYALVLTERKDAASKKSASAL